MDLDMFRGLVPFVAVTEEKSFRRAAARLSVSAAAVSKSVAELEERLGTVLLVRSARAVTLTREGATLFDGCRSAVLAVESARNALDHERSVPRGELVISAPFIASKLLGPALSLLRARFPKLSYRVLVTDRLSKLAEESVDVAVRVGPVHETSLIARRLRKTRLVTVAAPSYLARRGTPKDPSELSAHDCLGLVAPQGKPRQWLFASGPRDVPAMLLVDHGPTLVDMVVSGLGVTQLFDFMADDLAREGVLTRLFEAPPSQTPHSHAPHSQSETADGPDVWAVCAPGRRAAPRVRAAFEAFADAISRTR